MNEKLKYTLTLLILGVVSAATLAGIYSVTKERIDAEKAKKKKGALLKMEDFLGTKFEVSEPKKFYPEGKGKEPEVEFFEVKEKGKFYGYAILSAQYGYSSDINMMVLAVPDKDSSGKKTFKVKLARVTQSSETPGLGERIKEEPVTFTLYDLVANPEKAKEAKNKKTWPTFMERFNEKKKEEIEKVAVISGATISSAAVKGAIKKALEWAERIDRNEGEIEGEK